MRIEERVRTLIYVHTSSACVYVYKRVFTHIQV